MLGLTLGTMNTLNAQIKSNARTAVEERDVRAETRIPRAKKQDKYSRAPRKTSAKAPQSAPVNWIMGCKETIIAPVSNPTQHGKIRLR